MNGVEVIRAISLGRLPHGFLGRRGGMSVGECAGLNVGSAARTIAKRSPSNRRLRRRRLVPGAELATVHQVHSAEAVVADEAWPQDERPRADAMVTDRPNLLLGISPPIARRCCSPITRRAWSAPPTPAGGGRSRG